MSPVSPPSPGSNLANPSALIAALAAPMPVMEALLAIASLFVSQGAFADARTAILLSWSALLLAHTKSAGLGPIVILARAAREAKGAGLKAVPDAELAV